METCVERISGWTAYRRVTDSNLHGILSLRLLCCPLPTDRLTIANKQQIDAMEVVDGRSDGDDENDVENVDENGDEELGDDSQRYQGMCFRSPSWDLVPDVQLTRG
jgi:hypothetical protein